MSESSNIIANLPLVVRIAWYIKLEFPSIQNFNRIFDDLDSFKIWKTPMMFFHHDHDLDHIISIHMLEICAKFLSYFWLERGYICYKIIFICVEKNTKISISNLTFFTCFSKIFILPRTTLQPTMTYML